MEKRHLNDGGAEPGPKGSDVTVVGRVDLGLGVSLETRLVVRGVKTDPIRCGTAAERVSWLLAHAEEAWAVVDDGEGRDGIGRWSAQVLVRVDGATRDVAAVLREEWLG